MNNNSYYTKIDSIDRKASNRIGFIVFMLIVAALLAGMLIGGIVQKEAFMSPDYLSIKANDKAYIDDLAAEARSMGECVVIVPLPKDSEGYSWYWLHSC